MLRIVDRFEEADPQCARGARLRQAFVIAPQHFVCATSSCHRHVGTQPLVSIVLTHPGTLTGQGPTSGFACSLARCSDASNRRFNSEGIG